MSSTNPFDAHVASPTPATPPTAPSPAAPAKSVLASLIEEALGGESAPAASPVAPSTPATPAVPPAPVASAARKRPSGKHWSAADNEAHYAAVVATMMDEDLSFDDACTQVASEVKRQRTAFRSAMAVIARREKATRLLGV